MKIGLVGYGKMGQAIEQVAIERGHEIVLRITSSNQNEMTAENLQKTDVVIEFTKPESGYENVTTCLSAGVPTVCGTTGWSDNLGKAKLMTVEKNTSFLWASNFSIGVNIFFEINKVLASLMNEQPAYDVMVEEIHHTHKKDSPSGTAITIAEQILANLQRKAHWKEAEKVQPDELQIVAKRIDPCPGTHSVKYSSDIDDIEIIHTAHNRKGFALGAVLAAEFIAGKKGNYTMQDVLGINRG
jgi:4-hydroxy-tetrahydrodipicolinate reductase